MIKNSTKTHALKEIVLGLSIFVACTLFLMSGAVAPKDSGAQEGLLPSLTGWAWSDNIGWICFDDSCAGSVNPRVEILANYNLDGWAWSDNIGWIRFGDLTDFPDGDGTDPADAKYDPATKEITGWARACAGTVNGDCSTMESRDDGWDGWISLSGTGYGMKVDEDDNESIVSTTESDEPFAWGSEVVGWVTFKDVGVEGLSDDCTYEGQNIVNGGQLVINGTCDEDGNRTVRTVVCTDGSAVPTDEVLACPVADCTLPPLSGQSVRKPLAVGAAPETRYSRSQVRAGESCDDFKAQLSCTAVPGGEDQPPTGQLSVNPPRSGIDIEDYIYANCRALPGVLER